MIISMNGQLNLLVFSFISGIITGIMFDLYRLIRGIENPNNIITFIEDILFWILASIIVFIFLLYTNYAYIGAYVYLFIAFGTIAYLKSLSKYLINVLSKFIKVTGKVFRSIFNIIFFPIEYVVYTIFKRKK